VPNNRIDQARPFFTLAVVVVAWLVIPVALKTFSRASFFEFSAPLAVSASYGRDLQEFWSLRLHSNAELIEAGRDLARLNASYALSIQQDAELRSQVERFEHLLRMPPFANYRAEVARIVRRDFSGWWQSMVIRKGANYGITVGAPVVFAGGVVGRVKEVHAYTSVVELISSPGIRIAAVIEGDDRPISYQGGVNPTFGPAKATVEFVPLDVFAAPTAPKKLVTSGHGGVFPGGLTLGNVVKLEPSPDGLFKSGEVELDPNLSNLNEVTVLVPAPQSTEEVPPTPATK
jgi:rod shape-determining protein MreC